MPGPWEKYRQPTQQGAGYRVYGQGDPYKAADEQRAAAADRRAAAAESRAQAADARDAQMDTVTAQLKQLQLADEQRKAVQMSEATNVGDELLNVIDSAARAHKISRTNRFATGSLLTPVYGKIPGTEGKDLGGLLSTIGANTAFEKLRQMRLASPTGGALGAVTERELDLLKSTIGSLDPEQTDAEFQRNMKKVQDAYTRVLVKLPQGRQRLIEWRNNWIKSNSPKGGRQSTGGWSIEAID